MTFQRHERLKNEQTIAQLFKTGQSFACYPLRLVYLEMPSDDPLSKKMNFSANEPIQVAFSVPKKNFKHATDRNQLRRRVREAYRLHKLELYNFLTDNSLHANKHFAFMILYTAKEALPYQDIQKGIRKMIYRFKESNAKLI